ncbi:MAG: hypothetical protein GOV01_01985 [Candidatus Altiarchaeota archaeon]|nr:hypothetical protein [Candidatus Altiarchaeota archaeon]
MKGVGLPEVVIVLGLLVVLIAGFLPSGTPDASKEVLLLSKQVGPLGSEGFNYQHIKLGDNVVLSKGVEGTPLLTQAGPIEVAKGLITAQEHVVEFSIPSHIMEELSSSSISFRIIDTNRYGPFKVSLNGFEVWSDYLTRGQTVEIDLPVGQLSSDNTVKITAGSSGWKIWSPTFYIIENLQIKEKLTSGEEKTFEFILTPDQLEKFYKGRVYIGNVNPIIQGEIAMILNDERIIFRGVPGKGSVINSFSSGVKAENTLTLRLIEDGHYELTNLEVIIFTSANTSAGFSSDFSIPLDDLSKMRTGIEEGVIEIEVLETAEESLKVILSGETDIELYKGVPEKGILVLKFTGFEATKDNTLIISSVGDYNIGTVEVRLVKK